MSRRSPRSNRTDPLFPYPMLFRSRHTAVLVTAGDRGAAKAALADVPGVASIEEDGRDRLFVLPRTGADIVETVGAALRANRVPVSGITVERGRLDEVFRTITAV